MNPLYAYLYDDFLSEPAYQRVLANVETRCSVLGIRGRVSRLAIFRSAKELVEGLVGDGAQTIVIVGSDATLEKVMWFLPDLPVVIGYIPLAEPSGIASLLGIPFGENACETLAARRIETIDMGKVNDRYFLTEVVVRDTRASVNVEGNYSIGCSQAGMVSIRNLGGITAQGVAAANAKDSQLELVVQPMPTENAPSRFSFFKRREKLPEGTHMFLKHGTISSSEPIDAVADGHQMNAFSFAVSVLPFKLKIITGRKKKLEASASTTLAE